MKITTACLVALAMAIAPVLSFADASYEKSTKISGGQFVDMLKNVPMISKQMRSLTDPISTITMVHGNMKSVVNKESTEITDLDKRLIIHIDSTKKTYSIMTFDEMRKFMAEMPKKMEQMQQQMKDAQAKGAERSGPAVPANLQFNFSASVSDPGVTRDVNGIHTKQQILTLKTIVTDTDNPTTNMTYTVTDEIWTTAELPAEMKEVEDFDMRFGKIIMAGADLEVFKKMAANFNAAMAQMLGGRPGATEAMAQMQKELAKIKGTRILEIQRMGGSGTGMPDPQTASGSSQGATPGSSPATPRPNGGSVGGQIASDTAKNTVAGESSRFGIPGASLGGALAGAWGKHKAKQQTPPPAPAPAPAAAAPAAVAPPTPVDVTLMEMTTETKDFSREEIPASVFQVPDGFKQVPSPMAQMMAK